MGACRICGAALPAQTGRGRRRLACVECRPAMARRRREVARTRKARQCAAPDCQQALPADARPDRRYCGSGCRWREGQRRHRAASAA